MFQLEHEIQEWTKSFGRMEAMRSSDTEEMESHLRDSIAGLTTKGLSDEEAFLIATHRVGDPSRVGREFAKVNGRHVWRHRMFWMLAGFLFFEVCGLTITAIAELSQVFAALAGGNGTAIGCAYVVITLLCWLGLAIWLHRLSTDRNDGNFITRVVGHAKARVIGIGVVVIVVISQLVKFGSLLAVVRMTSISEIGREAMILNGASKLFAVLIPLAFLFVMLTIRKRMRDTITFEQ